MRTFVLCIAAALSLASATHSAYKAVEEPAPSGVTDADLYTATVTVLNDLGYGLRDKDSAAGMVSTEFVTVDNTMGIQTLHSWRAVISEGSLRLAIDCAKIHEGSRTDCGDARVDDWIKQEPELRQAIFDEAARRSAKRTPKQAHEPAVVEAVEADAGTP